MSTLDSLYQVILDRKENPTPGSYTAQLLAKGENEILKKMGEEAVEVIIAAKGETRRAGHLRTGRFSLSHVRIPGEPRFDLG